MAPELTPYQRADQEGLFDDPVLVANGWPILDEKGKAKKVRKPLHKRNRIMARLAKEVVKRDWDRDAAGDVPEEELKTRVQIGREDEDRARRYEKERMKKTSASTAKGKKQQTKEIKSATGKRKRVDDDEKKAGKSKPSPQSMLAPSSPPASAPSPLPPSKKQKPSELVVRVRILSPSALQPPLLPSETRVFCLAPSATRDELIERLNDVTVGEGYAVEDYPPPGNEGKEWGWEISMAGSAGTRGDVWMDEGITVLDLVGDAGKDGVLRLVGRIVAV